MRRFTLSVEGCEPVHGVLTESADELDALLAGLADRGATNASIGVTRAPAQQRPRGRPSFDTALAKAVAQLSLDASRPLADRARDVLKHLAETAAEPELIPARRTVENYLAEHCAVRKKERRKSRNKARRKSLALS